MWIENHLMIKLILLVQIVKGSLTSGKHKPKKEKVNRCLIPQDDFCVHGYAYIVTANKCQKVPGGSCESTDILPFKTKKECESECLIIPPAVEISRRAEKVQPALGDDGTQSHSEILETDHKSLHMKKKISIKSGINNLKAGDSENIAPAYIDTSEENIKLEENDYDWYDYKDYMVNNVHRCSQPREVSMCRGFWPRWWFNKSAGECQEFTYGGCGRDDQTTNNFLTRYHCMTVCQEIISCPDDISKACNVSATECATPSCPANQDVICQVKPCTCEASYIDDFGDQVDCIAKPHQHKDDDDIDDDDHDDDNDDGKEKLQMWVLWLSGALAMIVLVLCIICCCRHLQTRAYRNIQQVDTSISLDSSDGCFTPQKVFEKPVKA